MDKEYGEVEEDDDEEGQDEDHSQRGEDPQQVLHDAEVILGLAQSSPLLQWMEDTQLGGDTSQPYDQHLRSPLKRSTLQIVQIHLDYLEWYLIAQIHVSN